MLFIFYLFFFQDEMCEDFRKKCEKNIDMSVLDEMDKISSGSTIRPSIDDFQNWWSSEVKNVDAENKIVIGENMNGDGKKRKAESEPEAEVEATERVFKRKKQEKQSKCIIHSSDTMTTKKRNMLPKSFVCRMPIINPSNVFHQKT